MAKKAEDRVFNVCVIGLSGTERDKGVYGVGKSCLCNRFVSDVADKYYHDHISVLSQSDFAGRVINNDHFLYWGETTKTDDGNNFTFNVIEQTEFTDDVSFQPFKTGRETYIKRCVVLKVQSAEKLMYICKDQLGMETDSAYDQKLMPDGKLSIDGFICCFDVSEVAQRTLEHQVEFVTALLNAAVKTKKPVVLVTTKNEEAKERYLKEAANLVMRKEFSRYNIPIIGTSAHENVNVEQAFLALAHLIDKTKFRPKITPFNDAVKQRKELLDVATEAYRSILRTYVTDPKAVFNNYKKRLEKEPDFDHYKELFGTDNAKKLFRQHARQLREEQIRKREQNFIGRLPDVLQRFLPDLDTIGERSWIACQYFIRDQPEFSDIFVDVCEEGESWKTTQEFLDNYQETRIPFDMLSSMEAENIFRSHLSGLQAEHRKQIWKNQFRKLLSENSQVTPGKSLEEVYIFFVGKDCYNDLAQYEREQVYREYQNDLKQLAKQEFHELLWEKSDLFIRQKMSSHATDRITTDNIQEITDDIQCDIRFRRLDKLEEDRQVILYNHLGLMECPSREICYFKDKCAETQVQSLLEDVSSSVSRSHRISTLSEKECLLNLVLLGNEGLATELYKQIRNVFPHDQFQYYETVYSLDYRPIEDDVSLDYNSFETANFKPYACLCIYSSEESLQFVDDSLEMALKADPEDVSSLSDMPVIIIQAYNPKLTEREQNRLTDKGRKIAKRYGCEFVDIFSDEDTEPSKIIQLQIEESLLLLVGCSANGPNSHGSEDPDLRIAMCVMCGDSFQADVPLGPLLNSNPTQVEFENDLSVTVETIIDDNPDLTKQKVEVIAGSYHNFVARVFKDQEDDFQGFILVFSPKRRASFCTMKAFAENLRNLNSIMPILILAVTENGGASVFFTDESSKELIQEGNKIADELGSVFMITTANFQQQTPVYMSFLKDVWSKRDELKDSYYSNPSSPPFDDKLNRSLSNRPPPPLPKFDQYPTTKSSTSNSQSTEESEPIYDTPTTVPHPSDSEHEGPSSASPTLSFSSPNPANGSFGSDQLVRPSMLRKHKGANAGGHREYYRKSFPIIEPESFRLLSYKSLEQADTDKEPQFQFKKSHSMKLAMKEEEEAWALNEPHRQKKASTFPSDVRQFSRDNDSWIGQSRQSIGSRDSEETVWADNDLYHSTSMLDGARSKAPLALPEQDISVADYGTVRDAVVTPEKENDYCTVDDVLPPGRLQRITSQERKKKKAATDESEDSEFSSLERESKNYSRKPTPHKKKIKQKSQDGQQISIPVYTDEPRKGARYKYYRREIRNRERSNSPSEGSEGTGDEIHLVKVRTKEKKRRSLKSQKWGSESSGQSAFSPQYSDSDNLVGSPPNYKDAKDYNTVPRAFRPFPSSYDDENGQWKNKIKTMARKKEKKEDKQKKDDERKKQKELKEEERKQKEQQKHLKKGKKKEGRPGTSESGCKLGEYQMSSNNPSLPQFVETCVEYIDLEGMNTEGIYRIPGNKQQVALLQSKLQEDPCIDIHTLDIQVNTVATVLKTFLNETEPLIQSCLHDELLEAAGMPDKSARLLALRGVLKKMYPTNYEVLKYFITHLKRVSSHKDSHSMDSRNLALCLWPTLFRIDFKSYDKMTQGTKLPPEIVQTLIEQCGFFFHGEDEVAE